MKFSPPECYSNKWRSIYIGNSIGNFFVFSFVFQYLPIQINFPNFGEAFVNEPAFFYCDAGNLFIARHLMSDNSAWQNITFTICQTPLVQYIFQRYSWQKPICLRFPLKTFLNVKIFFRIMILAGFWLLSMRCVF